jgi:hypothetical protein
MARADLHHVLELREPRPQSSDIAAANRMFDIFSPPPDDSDVISQVDRLSSNQTKIAPNGIPNGTLMLGKDH